VAAQVDPVAGLVRVGDRCWPLELDLRTGSAAIEIDGQRVHVRPLAWQEKVRLARYRHLGAEFLEHQTVRLCLVTMTDLTGGRPAVEPAAGDLAGQAVAAVVRWVNEPDPAAPTVPLDTAALAQVSAAVCRVMGIRPADLADCAAAEVEELYRAVTGMAEPPVLAAKPVPPVDDGVSRIVIVPDPTPAAVATDEPPVRSAASSEPTAREVPTRKSVRRFQVAAGPGAGPLPLATPRIPAPKVDAELPSPGARAAAEEPVEPSAPAGPGRSSARDEAIASESPAPRTVELAPFDPTPYAAVATQHPTVANKPRSRVRPATLAEPVSRTKVPQASPAPAIGPRAPVTAATAGPATGPDTGSFTEPMLSPLRRPAPVHTADPPWLYAPNRTPSPADPGGGNGRPPWPVPIPASRADEDRRTELMDEIVEELCDRLEKAAAELGVDFGGW